MVQIYKGKGFSEEDAREVVEILTRNPKYRDYFVDHMVTERAASCRLYI